MTFFSPLPETIATAIKVLQEANVGFNLVKPHEGEFTRDEKQNQVKESTFAAQVNLASPFALISSQGRPVERQENRSITLKHALSVYIGVRNTHNLSSKEIPPVLYLLEKCATVLVGQRLHARAGDLTLVNGGIFLAKTDLYIVYEQQYAQLERAIV